MYCEQTYDLYCYFRDAKNIHSKYMRHQAFESEIAANKPRLETLQKDGHGLVDEKPDSGEVVSSLSGIMLATTTTEYCIISVEVTLLYFSTCLMSNQLYLFITSLFRKYLSFIKYILFCFSFSYTCCVFYLSLLSVIIGLLVQVMI